MNLIERYVFKKAAFAFLVTLGALCGVVWIAQAVKGLEIISSNGQGVITYLTITSLIVPNLAMAVVPIALMIACVQAINTLNANTELVVITASGASNRSVAKPLLILALLCSLFAGLIGHLISPWSLVKVKTLVTEMHADLVSVILREGTFNEVEQGLTFHIGKRDAGGILSNIMISDEREEDKSAVYSANQGIISRNERGSFLKLKNGEIQQTDRNDESVTVIRYETYLFDLSSFSGKGEVGRLRPKEQTTFQLLNPDPNDKAYQDDPHQFAVRIHERFSEMLWPFANVLVILAFAGQARSNRQSYASSIGSAILVLVAARGLGFMSFTNFRNNPDAIYFVYAIPIACIIFGSIFVWLNRPVELPKPIADRIEKIQIAIQVFFDDLNDRYLRFRRRVAGVKS